MGYSTEDCVRDTKEHIDQVRYFMDLAIADLNKRAKAHDQSKLTSPELEYFTEATERLKSSTYGSEEYKGFLKELKPALDHHYAHNSHHPEHYEQGIRGMNLFDVVEMLCDWKAATMRHADGDLKKSIEINQKRFGYSDDLKQIFLNTVGFFEEGDK